VTHSFFGEREYEDGDFLWSFPREAARWVAYVTLYLLRGAVLELYEGSTYAYLIRPSYQGDQRAVREMVPGTIARAMVARGMVRRAAGTPLSRLLPRDDRPAKGEALYYRVGPRMGRHASTVEEVARELNTSEQYVLALLMEGTLRGQGENMTSFNNQHANYEDLVWIVFRDERLREMASRGRRPS
jgi:hypothetical protein